MFEKYSPWPVEERQWYRPWRSGSYLWYWGSCLLLALLLAAFSFGLMHLLTVRASTSKELSWTRRVRPCCSSDVCLRQRHHVGYSVQAH